MSKDLSKFSYKEIKNCICGAVLNSNKQTIEKFTSWGFVRFIQCSKCFTMVQSPQITTDSLKLWYSSPKYYETKNTEGIYLNYLLDEKQRKIESIVRYKRDIENFIDPNSDVLEIGCSTGSFLSVLRENGHQVTGIDLSDDFANQAKLLHGININIGNFLDFKFEPNSFDLVILLGTISNLVDLPSHITKINTILKPKGFLYFNFPVYNSMISKLYGSKFWMYSPTVSNFISYKGCQKFLEKANFTIVQKRIDFQTPTLSKIIGHAKFHSIYPLIKMLNLDQVALPFPIPIPGVLAIWAKKSDNLIIMHIRHL